MNSFAEKAFESHRRGVSGRIPDFDGKHLAGASRMRAACCQSNQGECVEDERYLYETGSHAAFGIIQKKILPLCNFCGAMLRLMHENGLKPQTINNDLKEIRQ